MSMITVNRIGEDSITGSLNGKPFGISYDEQKYAKMKDLETQAQNAQSMEELKAIVEEFEPLLQENYSELIAHAKGGQYLWVNKHTGKVFLAINGKTSSQPLPKTLVDRIIYSVDKQIGIDPLVKNWARFLRNPLYSISKSAHYAQYINTTVINHEFSTKLMKDNGLSEEVANQRATMFDVSFTQEGLLATYKVVESIDYKFGKGTNAEGDVVVKKMDRFEFEVDEFTGLKKYKKPDYVEQYVFEPCMMRQGGDEFFSGDYKGHIIRVGQICALESMDMVDTNDSHSCVKGLHTGGLRYIKNYQKDNTITLNAFVDPFHIGGIDNGGTGALRVQKYFPHSALDIPTQNLYHSSSYAKLADEEYEKLVTEAVAAYAAEQTDAEKALEEKKNLAKI